jgi:hypothetical protein
VPGDDGPFIRDAYDALFDKIERLEHFIQIDLIRFKDVAEPLRYYVVKLAARDERPVIERFIATYGFTEAQSFLNRFREWKPGAEDKPLALRPWWKFWRVG